MIYNRIKKKEYQLQIWQDNVRYTNIIMIKDGIISEKTREITLLEGLANIIAPAKVT